MACFYPSLLFLSLLVALQGVVVSRASEKITLIYAVQILFLGNWMAVERNLALFVRGITFWEDLKEEITDGGLFAVGCMYST